jgi:predicted alpha/beta hydrolase
MAQTQDTHFSARDGYRLAATEFAPEASPRGAVVINSATAVPRRIYRGFATYLAERGFAVLTYDYRGVAGSRPASLAGFPARMRDCAALDVTAALDHARARWPDLSLAVVGHSFGGQALGLVPNNDLVSRTLMIAAQAGYWGCSGRPRTIACWR